MMHRRHAISDCLRQPRFRPQTAISGHQHCKSPARPIIPNRSPSPFHGPTLGASPPNHPLLPSVLRPTSCELFVPQLRHVVCLGRRRCARLCGRRPLCWPVCPSPRRGGDLLVICVYRLCFRRSASVSRLCPTCGRRGTMAVAWRRTPHLSWWVWWPAGTRAGCTDHGPV